MQSKKPIRDPVVSVPCLTCRIARTFTTLARRGTYSSLYNSVSKVIFIHYRIFLCVFEEHWSLELHKCQRSSLKQILDSVNIKSRSNILTRVQSKAYTEPSSFSSLFNLPYSKDIHYFSQARHIAHSTTQCRKLYLYTS